jgi:hypothetical protein
MLFLARNKDQAGNETQKKELQAAGEIENNDGYQQIEFFHTVNIPGETLKERNPSEKITDQKQRPDGSEELNWTLEIFQEKIQGDQIHDYLERAAYTILGLAEFAGVVIYRDFGNTRTLHFSESRKKSV